MNWISTFMIGLTLTTAVATHADEIRSPLNDVWIQDISFGTNATLCVVLHFLADETELVRQKRNIGWRPIFVLKTPGQETTITASEELPDYQFDPENNPRCPIVSTNPLPLKKALDMVCEIVAAHWTTEGDSIVIELNNKGTQQPPAPRTRSPERRNEP